MRRSERRLIALAAGMILLIVAAALIYRTGMSVLEGKERGFWQSLEWAGETLSTTGYGRDANWNHPVMILFVVGLQFVGLCLVFLVFPVYLLPALEERFQSRLPRSAPEFKEGVLIFGWGAAVFGLTHELKQHGITPIIIEPDEAQARLLADEGRSVVFGTVSDGVLDRVHLDRVRAVVVNEPAAENAAITLALRQQEFSGEIFGLVEEPRHRKAISLAGANAVFTPRHILAAALAAHASDRVSPRVIGAQALGARLTVSEMKLDRTSAIVGKTLSEADVGSTGINVIGQWVRGKLVSPVPPDQPLEADSILIIAGDEANVMRFSEVANTRHPKTQRPFFIAGFGEVGRTVATILTSVGEKVTTLDELNIEGVDIVGDIADHRLLQSKRIEAAQAVILAVGSDSATLLATLVLREYAPRIPIIARVNEASNVERIHRAGADFALSISQVSGQLLTGRLLGRESISVNPQLKIVRTTGKAVAGRHPSELHIRHKTGASVVAVERGDQIWVRLTADFRFETDDAVYICGSEDAIQSYFQEYPEKP